jgi:D-serine deaminase-like pyridoxal phosphate-dependent protein
VTTSTLAEVWAFAQNGFSDFTYAVPIEQGKFAEAIEIVKSGAKLNALTDNVEIPPALNEAAKAAGVRLDVFLKVDCGYHRCGVEPRAEEAVAIPRSIAAASNLNFAGILTHAGHSYHARSTEELAAIARHERDSMVGLADKLRRSGIEVPTVSIGSTPTITHVDHLRGVTEVRPGNYIFFDAFQATLGSCGFEDCALTVLAAVTHHDRARRKIVVDAGAIALSKDRGPVELDAGCGYGRVLDLEGGELGLRVGELSQEHGVFYVPDEATFERLRVGSRVRILANHSCLSAAQHAHFHVLENGKITDRWTIHRGW